MDPKEERKLNCFYHILTIPLENYGTCDCCLPKLEVQPVLNLCGLLTVHVMTLFEMHVKNMDYLMMIKNGIKSLISV